MSLCLTIDLGTTNLKVGVVSANGKVLALRRASVQASRPEPGAAEHDHQSLTDLIISLSREVSRDFRSEITCICLSSYQFGLILLDERKLPLTDISLLTDIRARSSYDEFKDSIDTNALYLRTGCPPLFQYALARLFYFNKKNPELLKKTRYILSSKDYLVYRLTGELVAEQSCAAATQLLDINTFSWDPDGMKLLRISPELFPPLVDGMKTSFPLLDSVRHEMGLTSKPVVVPGVYDGAALAIGVTGLQPRIGVMNVGTSAMVRVHGERPVFDNTGEMRLQINTLSSRSFLNGGAINNATLPLTWMQNNLFDLDLREFDHFNPHKGPPLFCLPYLTGERDAKVGANASGVFFGLREQHGKKEMVRALFEGVAYSLALIKNSLTANNVKIEELRLGGGGANSKGWAKIFADVLNTSIRLPRGEEPALVGNAIVGFTASGRFESFDEAVETMVTTGPVIEPSTDSVKQYARYFEFFQKLREASAPLFAEQVKL